MKKAVIPLSVSEETARRVLQKADLKWTHAHRKRIVSKNDLKLKHKFVWKVPRKLPVNFWEEGEDSILMEQVSLLTKPVLQDL